MSQPDHANKGNSADLARALDEVRRLIPEGSNRAILAALATLAEAGDEAALHAVEAHLAAAPLSVDYGDRDSDPLPWELDRRAYALLARWWERLGLTGERGARLAASWLGDSKLFDSSSYSTFTLFVQLAPRLAAHVAPPLIAACADGRAERRARAAGGLQYAPTDAALDTLAALLDDNAERVASAARNALSLLASPLSPGSRRSTPSAPDAVALRLLDTLGSGSAAARQRALAALPWFAGGHGRGRITLPPHHSRLMAAVARLLVDPDPQVQQRAAERLAGAGYHLDQLRPSQAAALDLRLPPLDLLPLLDHESPEVVRAALSLAGRAGAVHTPPHQAALAGRILALLDRLRGDPFGYPAALHALGRLQVAAAIPAIAQQLERPDQLARVDALLVLARLRHEPAIPHLVRLLRDLTYRADAREALDFFDAADVLPLVLAQLRASADSQQGLIRAELWEVSYLEAHGDAEALALLRRTEGYQFAARYIGAEGDRTVAAIRRLERRLLLASGVSAPAADDPVATVRRILTGPVHPLERGEGEPADGELRARWRNLCVSIDAWLLAEPSPALEQALAEAEQLLAGFPDEVREAHERWWLDVTRGGQLGLPRISAVARAQVRLRAPWRLARALVVNEGIAGALEPSAALAWPGLAQITSLRLDDARWLKALADAPASFAPRVLRAGIYNDAVAAALAAWPGLARLERLEVVWSVALSDEARASLMGRTLASRREQVWRTPEGTYLVPLAFAPVHDSYGDWIARGDGSVLAVATTYAEVTAGGELLRSYGGPIRYYAPEETLISPVFEVVGGALYQYEWYEQERPAPGSLTATMVREDLVAEERSRLPFSLDLLDRLPLRWGPKFGLSA